MPDGLTQAGEGIINEYLDHVRQAEEARAEVRPDWDSWGNSAWINTNPINWTATPSPETYTHAVSWDGSQLHIDRGSNMLGVSGSLDGVNNGALRDVSSDLLGRDGVRRAQDEEDGDMPYDDPIEAPRLRNRSPRYHRNAEGWPPLKLLVCGGRDYNDYYTVKRTLDALKPTDICVGSTRGADGFAIDWAQDNGCNYRVVHADWNRYGRAAGPIRNERMLADFEPDLVVAFPGGRGTLNMVTIARRAGVRVQVVEGSQITEHNRTEESRRPRRGIIRVMDDLGNTR